MSTTHATPTAEPDAPSWDANFDPLKATTNEQIRQYLRARFSYIDLDELCGRPLGKLNTTDLIEFCTWLMEEPPTAPEEEPGCKVSPIDSSEEQIEDSEEPFPINGADIQIDVKEIAEVRYELLSLERDELQEKLDAATAQRDEAQKQLADLSATLATTQGAHQVAPQKQQDTIAALTREIERLRKKTASSTPQRFGMWIMLLLLASTAFLSFCNFADIRKLSSFPWIPYMKVNAGNPTSESYLQLSRYYLSTGSARVEEYSNKAFSTCEKGSLQHPDDGNIWYELGCLHLDGHGPFEKNSNAALKAGAECMEKAARYGHSTAKQLLKEFN